MGLKLTVVMIGFMEGGDVTEGLLFSPKLPSYVDSIMNCSNSGGMSDITYTYSPQSTSVAMETQT